MYETDQQQKESKPKLNEHETKQKQLLATVIEKAYKELMFTEGAVTYLGYNSGIGFKVEGIGYHEPPLQKLLSLLSIKIDELTTEEFIILFEKSLQAMRQFDPEREISPEHYNQFISMGCPAAINKIIDAFEKILQEINILRQT